MQDRAALLYNEAAFPDQERAYLNAVGALTPVLPGLQQSTMMSLQTI
jgi:hypothetical protein